MLSPNKVMMGSRAELIVYAKKEFNSRIARVKKAEEYFKNTTDSVAQVERNSRILLDILQELSSIGNEIEELTGEKINSDIAVNGFNEVR